MSDPVRKILTALIAVCALLLGLVTVGATTAQAATQSQSVNCWGYTYSGSVTSHRSGGTIVIDSYSISGPNYIEWRARWFAVAGNVIEDSLYHESDPSPINRSPGWSRFMGSGSQVLLNAGKYGDGHASCEMWFPIG